MRYRFIFAVIMSALFSCQTVGVRAATGAATESNTDVSQRLVGDWETNFTKKQVTPVKQVFVSLDSRKNFRIIRVVEVPGLRGRLEYDGKWRISNGQLILEPSRVRGLEWSEPFKQRVQNNRILSVEHDVLILRSEDGITKNFRRTPIPSQLPPLLPRGALAKAFTLYAPKPEYPVEARHEHLQGKGLFCLIVNEKTGIVSSVQVRQSTGHKILDEAAIRTLKTWRLRPETVEQLLVPIGFKLTTASWY